MRVAFWTSSHARSSVAMGVDSVHVAMRVALLSAVAMRVAYKSVGRRVALWPCAYPSSHARSVQLGVMMP